MRIHRLALLLSAIAAGPAIAEELSGADDPKQAMREAAIEKADVEPPPSSSMPGPAPPQRATPVDVERHDPGAMETARDGEEKDAAHGKKLGSLKEAMKVEGGAEKPHAAAARSVLHREVHRAAVEEAVRAAVAAPAFRPAPPAQAMGRGSNRGGEGGGGAGGMNAAEASRARAVRDSGSPGGKPPWANPGNGNGKGGRP